MNLTSLSQSSLQDHYDCPRRFELRYLHKLAYPAIETEPALENEKHQREGEYFHRLLQQYFIGIPADQLEKLANTEGLGRWWANFSSSAEVTALKQTPILRTELSLSAPLGGFRLVAKYDLIASDGKTFFIYDWKTYRKRPKNDLLAIRLQTRVYRALLVQAGAFLNNGQPIKAEQVEMIYWFSEFPQDPARFSYNVGQYQRDWDALTRLAEEIEAAPVFSKTEDATKCRFCAYRSYCNRGVLAGDASEAEFEVEAEHEFELNFEQIGEIEF